MSNAGQTALLLGATGQVGRHILKELISSPYFTKIGEFGRKVTDLDSIPGKDKEKVVQKTINFEKLQDAELGKDKWDVVFISLGTTRKDAGSVEAFEKIDREYVINAARAAKTDAPQSLVYISTAGADPSSRFLYVKSKGLTELGLAELGYDTIVFRPGILAGTNRGETRLGESIASFFTGIGSHFTSSLQIQISTLAKSAVFAGRLGSAALPATAQASQIGKGTGQFTMIGNTGAINLAKEAS